MTSLEDKLATRCDQPASWRRDAAGIGLLAAMGALLVPSWADAERYLTDVAGQMASIYLLMSLGFLLAARCGAIDVSIWAASALGGLVSAWCINRGAGAAWSLAAGAAAGAVLGAVNGALTAWARLPSLVATIATGAVTIWALGAGFPGRSVTVPDDAFAHWHLVSRFDSHGDEDGAREEKAPPLVGTRRAEQVALPLVVTRMVLVAGVYGAAVLGLLVASRRIGWSRRRLLFAALCGSGALAGAGGAFWLVDQGTTAVPTRLVDDLRAPAAAILAGAFFFSGRGRSLLAAACLPAATLLVTIWQVRVWNVSVWGYPIQVVALMGMTAVAHLAAGSGARPGRMDKMRAAGAALAIAGLLIVAGSAGMSPCRAKEVLLFTGIGASLAAGVMLLLRKLIRAGVLRSPG